MVAFAQGDGFCGGTGGGKGEDAVVFEQDDALGGGFVGEVLGVGGHHVGPGYVAVWTGFAVEVACADEAGVETGDAAFEVLSGDFLVVEGFLEVAWVGDAAVDVGSCADGVCGGG